MIIDCSAEYYHAGKLDDKGNPAISNSIAKVLLQNSPKHAWLEHPRLNPNWQPDDDKKFDRGTAAHALLLENDHSRIEVLDFADYRTKAAQEARKEALDAGRLPLLAEQYEIASNMVKVAHRAIANNPDFGGLTLKDGEPEQTILWTEQTLCKARLDWLSNDRSLILDYKTTEIANPQAWMRSMIPQFLDLQASWYTNAVTVECQIIPKFVFMVQETFGSNEVYFVGADPGLLEIGERKRKLALKIWCDCLQRDRWPGYSNRIMYNEIQPWHLADVEEREIRFEYSYEAMFGGLKDEFRQSGKE